jgi:hypothetical protein
MSSLRERVEEAVMDNNVLNFSWKPPGPITLHHDLKVGIVPSTLSAVEAAEIAERNGWDVLLVTDDGAPAGAFFHEYLSDFLPGHAPLTNRVTIVPGTPLPQMIQLIDAAGIDFHSELVNINPDLRKCPAGHITSENPCPRHGMPTTQY